MKIYRSLTDSDVAAQLRAGGVGVIPTDTVYGLVARAGDETAVAKLYSLKQRARQPGTIIAANTEQLESLGFSKQNLSIATPYWPGAISVLENASEVSGYLKTDLEELAVRIPDHPELIKLLESTGPLMTTSANAPHQPTATNFADAYGYFEDNVDFYVDGGEIGEHLPSTIIRVRGNKIEILRHGAVEI